MPINRLCSLLLAAILAGGLAGCGSAPVIPPPEAAPQAPVRPETSDQARLHDALTGRELPAAEAAELSDRLLATGNEVSDQDMARLELVILKGLKSPDKASHAVLWRNLGIIHFHQAKYKQARQNLQQANELNPRNARTHYYLAKLCIQQGEIYERQGKKSKSRQQLKMATTEMELARKLEPNNPLYRQNTKK